MSWDAHVGAGVANSPLAKGAVVFGKDGTVWGKMGCVGNVCSSELKDFSTAAKNKDSCYLDGSKFMFITEVDGCSGYRAGPVSASGYVGENHCGFVIGSEEARVPDCAGLALKLKEYMKSIGQV